MHRTLLSLVTLTVLCPFNATADELLLEDYQNGGIFNTSRFDNDFQDSLGRQNISQDVGDFSEVKWAAKWSGLASTGLPRNLSRFRTFQVDVMVKPGQPVEEETNFYFQLLNQVETGYSYWEFFVPQNKIKADGKWYRVQFPMSKFYGSGGGGGARPENFETILGCVGGMTFDEDGDKFEFKIAHFDNFKLTDVEVADIVVQPALVK